LHEYGWKRITEARRKELLEYLEGEVETYDQWSSGDVYWYNITAPNGEDVDSCGGFYGYDYCLEEAKSIVDHMVAKAPEPALLSTA
jgi:hypothetical protein